MVLIWFICEIKRTLTKEKIKVWMIKGDDLVCQQFNRLKVIDMTGLVTWPKKQKGCHKMSHCETEIDCFELRE